MAHINMNISPFPISNSISYREQLRIIDSHEENYSHTGVLFDNAILFNLEASACGVRPPFFKFTMLVVQAPSRIECMLLFQVSNDLDDINNPTDRQFMSSNLTESTVREISGPKTTCLGFRLEQQNNVPSLVEKRGLEYTSWENNLREH